MCFILVYFDFLQWKAQALFTWYNNQKNHLDYYNEEAIKACEIFLKDTVNQDYFNITDIDDYIYILSTIAANNYSDFYHLSGTPGYINVVFSIKLPEGDKFSFTSPIPSEALEKADLPANTLLPSFDGHISDIFYEIDKTNKKVILVKYYQALAQKALSNPQILNNPDVMLLKRFHLG